MYTLEDGAEEAVLMISEDVDSTLYTLVTHKSQTLVNQIRVGNVEYGNEGNMKVSTRDTAREPHTGGGSIQNV